MSLKDQLKYTRIFKIRKIDEIFWNFVKCTQFLSIMPKEIHENHKNTKNHQNSWNFMFFMILVLKLHMKTPWNFIFFWNYVHICVFQKHDFWSISSENHSILMKLRLYRCFLYTFRSAYLKCWMCSRRQRAKQLKSGLQKNHQKPIPPLAYSNQTIVLDDPEAFLILWKQGIQEIHTF